MPGDLRQHMGPCGTANPDIIHPARQPGYDLKHRREDVEMLMAVEMRKSQPGFLESPDLCRNLPFDFIPGDPPKKF